MRKEFIRDFVKSRVREELFRESVEAHRITNIDDDDLYDSLIHQADKLSRSSEIGFGAAEPFGVLVNMSNGELLGATWLESSGNFTFHIIIRPEYRGRGLSKLLLDDLMSKYEQMKTYRGDQYKILVNVVNDNLANNLIKNYGFKVLKQNGVGGVIMTK